MSLHLENNSQNVMFFVYHFQMLKQNVYLLLESLVQLNDLNLDFVLIILVLIKYLFQLITLFKPEFNCGSRLELSCVDKVTTETCSLVSVILNVPAPVEVLITQADDHVKIKLKA